MSAYATLAPLIQPGVPVHNLDGIATDMQQPGQHMLEWAAILDRG